MKLVDSKHDCEKCAVPVKEKSYQFSPGIPFREIRFCTNSNKILVGFTFSSHKNKDKEYMLDVFAKNAEPIRFAKGIEFGEDEYIVSANVETNNTVPVRISFITV